MEQLVARRAHNPKVVGSSPAPATSSKSLLEKSERLFAFNPIIVNRFFHYLHLEFHFLNKAIYIFVYITLTLNLLSQLKYIHYEIKPNCIVFAFSYLFYCIWSGKAE